MRQKLESQIQYIATFSYRITQQYNIPTTAFIQQEQQIKKLTEGLLQELDKFHFALFNVVMREREYDATIHYDGQTEFSELTEADKQRFHERYIDELKSFFDEPYHSKQHKQEMEEIIIFAIFLQATFDCYQKLEVYFEKAPHIPNNDELNQVTAKIFLDYQRLLDNLAYKCNPTVYKAISGLNYTALWLVLSSLIILPLSVPLIMFAPPVLLAAIATALLIVFCFAYPTFLSIEPMLPKWTKHGWQNPIDARWGKDWAYPLPYHATDSQSHNPNNIGVLPSVFGRRPAIPAGSSFKTMNALGFFPFKQLASETIETTETLLKKTRMDETSVDLPNGYQHRES